jgi:hypothetical protein
MCRWKTILLILFFTGIKQVIGQTHVQTNWFFQNPSTSSTISLAFASASTSGNLIVVHLDWDKQSVHINTVTDNKGNTYKKINGTTNWNGANYAAELWYAYNITGGAGAITVTAKLTGNTTSFFQIYISEYSGIASSIDPLDQNAVAPGSTAAVSSGAKTTTYANELIYGASIGASGTLTKGAGFTSRSTANQNIIEDKNVAATGSYSTTFTSAGGNWVAQMATFFSSAIILPVNLLSFTGNCNNNQIVLNWTTASENNNDYFTIEESENGSDWKAIGTVNSKGNSSITQQYSFTTANTTDEISYFRLRQTDLDGKFVYFNVIKVNNCNAVSPGVNIYPNPTNGQSLSGRITLQPYETCSIEIYDNTGKKLARFSSVQSEFKISLPYTLHTGIYFARFFTAGASVTTRFVVKN